MAPSENPTSGIEPLLPSPDTNAARLVDAANVREGIRSVRPAVQKLLFCDDPESKSSINW